MTRLFSRVLATMSLGAADGRGWSSRVGLKLPGGPSAAINALVAKLDNYTAGRVIVVECGANRGSWGLSLM